MPTKTRSKKRVNRFQILTLVTLPGLVGGKKSGWWKKPKALLFSEESHWSEMTLMYQSINVYFTKKRLYSLCPRSFFLSLYRPFFCRLSIRRENIHTLWRKWRQSGDSVPYSSSLYSVVDNTLFFFLLWHSRRREKIRQKRNKRETEWSKSFVKAHYKDGRALLLLLLRGN